MDEKEAEAVLLALGPQLQWKASDRQGFWWTCTNNLGYRVEPTSPLRDKNHLPYAYAAVWIGKTENDQSQRHPYATVEEAQAACERHHTWRMQGNREVKWEEDTKP